MSDAYRRAGVDYDVLDTAKRLALSAARPTSANARRLGAQLLESSRGEPAVVIELGDLRLGFVLECLGTKSLVAAAVEAGTGADHWAAIGYDTVAAAVNDCCCVGALPFVVNAYFATGAAAFYEGTRHASLVEGFARACADAGAAWGGGESPTLSGLVGEDAIDLAAAAVGIIPEGIEPLTGSLLEPGDEIVLLSSTGLHANGASLAREVASGLPEGYATPLPSGTSLGDAVLVPSAIYVGLVEEMLGTGVPVHYLSHITGHGLRKLMRADRELCYRITSLPPVPEVLAFLAARAGLEAAASYATLNMGAGFACFLPPGSASAVVALAERHGFAATVAGYVEAGERAVVLEELGITWRGGDLELR